MSNPNHSSKDGRFVSKEFVKENKDTTVTITGEKSVKTSRNFSIDLKEAAKDLFVISETDSSFSVLSEANLRIVSLDKFFASQIITQPEKEERFLILKKVIQSNLNDPVILIIGEEPLKTLVVLGKDDKNNYKGLLSFVVET